MDRLYPSGACVMPSSLTFTRTGHEIYGWGYNACPARVKAEEEYHGPRELFARKGKILQFNSGEPPLVSFEFESVSS